MGARGPAPAPTKLKLLRGERHRDRLNFNEPQPSMDPVKPPPELSDDCRAVWDATAHELEVMGISHAADSDALHCYCEAVVNHRKASAVMAKSPVLIRGKDDKWVRNPALIVQAAAATLIRGFAQEFGLTPSARNRIENNREQTHDEAGDIFAGIG